MKNLKKILIPFLTITAFTLFSCEDLSEVNENPNSPEVVSSNYILTYVLTHTAKSYYALGSEGTVISGAMQFFQKGTNENAIPVNQYGWGRESWSEYYNILRNNQIMAEYAERDNNRFFKAISLTMKSFVFGLMTDLFGDIPYSEALSAKDGLYFPKYDKQIDVYKGILTDLKEAEALLQNLTASDAISASSDVYYKGDATKWRKFVNALRMRYSMRLANKKSEMSTVGINIVDEFKIASQATFTSNSDDALVEFLGTSSDNATPGGLLNSSNPNYLTKPAKPLIDQLQSTNDPRLYRWFQPVLNKWDASVKVKTAKTITSPFGEAYTITYMPITTALPLDTGLFVGLPVGLAVVDGTSYNKGDDATAYQPERSPYISFIHNRYRQNTDQYIKMNLLTYSEVEFLLAEAALTGDFGVSGTAEEHYKAGIKASLNKYGAISASGFNFDQFYAQNAINLATASNKQAKILEQKWISSWLGIESWFDWRRTGLPNLKTGPVAQFGPALPIRFMYPTPNVDQKYIVNYNSAVDLLESTTHVPSGQSKDHHYSKMWLLQGTNKPW